MHHVPPVCAAERVVLVVGGVEVHHYGEQDDQGKHNQRVDVGYVKGAAQPANDCVAADEEGEEHGGELGHQVVHKEVDGLGGLNQQP